MANIAVNGSEAKIKKQKKEADKSYDVYPQILGLDFKLFQLSNIPLTDEYQQQALGQVETYLKEQEKNFLGYQMCKDVHYSKQLSFMLDMHTNNIGDPFVTGNCTVNTKIMERAVLDHFAKLWHAQLPSDPANGESYWGYVLSMGSTEGNLYGLYNARDYLKGKALYQEANGDLSYLKPLKENAHSAHAYHPIAFYSQDTHYSITKIVRALEIRTFYEVGEQEYKGQCPITPDGQWPKEVPSENGNEGPGTVDVDKLIQLVEFFARTGSPPLIILNMGTAFKGAYDDVEKITNLLKPILVENKLYTRKVEYAPGKFDERTGYWVHVDGALGASYLPFLQRAHDRIKGHVPKFDFSLPLVHSIVTSAHKFPGCPMPSGIYMTKRKYQIAPPDDPEYIGSPDTTFAGSRNALSPAALWCYYANTSDEKEIEKAIKVQDTATYAETKLKKLGQEYQKSGYKLWVHRTPLSLAIIFRDPEYRDIISKYSLSQMKLKIDGENEPRKYAHIFIMPGVTNELIDELVEDLRHAYDKLSSSKQQNAVKERTSVSKIDDKRDIQRFAHVPLDSRGFSGN
jgi:histidine decarboxylase